MNKPLDILRERYGYDAFREQQADIIVSIWLLVAMRSC